MTLESTNGSPIFLGLADVSFTCTNTAGTSQSSRFRVRLQTARGERLSQWYPVDSSDGHILVRNPLHGVPLIGYTPPTFPAGAVIVQTVALMAEGPDALSVASVEFDNSAFKLVTGAAPPSIRIVDETWRPRGLRTAVPPPAGVEVAPVPALELIDAAG